MEAEGHESLLTNRVLEELIRFFGDKMVAMMGPYLEQQILQSLASQDLWRQQLSKAFTQPYPTPEQTIKTMVEHYQTLTGKQPPSGQAADDTDAASEPPTGESGDDGSQDS